MKKFLSMGICISFFLITKAQVARRLNDSIFGNFTSGYNLVFRSIHTRKITTMEIELYSQKLDSFIIPINYNSIKKTVTYGNFKCPFGSFKKKINYQLGFKSDSVNKVESIIKRFLINESDTLLLSKVNYTYVWDTFKGLFSPKHMIYKNKQLWIDCQYNYTSNLGVKEAGFNSQDINYGVESYAGFVALVWDFCSLERTYIDKNKFHEPRSYWGRAWRYFGNPYDYQVYYDWPMDNIYSVKDFDTFINNLDTNQFVTIYTRRYLDKSYWREIHQSLTKIGINIDTITYNFKHTKAMLSCFGTKRKNTNISAYVIDTNYAAITQDFYSDCKNIFTSPIPFLDSPFVIKKQVSSVVKSNYIPITISPNPASTKLFFSNYSAIKNIYIYNSKGQLCLNSVGKSSINIADFKGGVYLVKLQLKDNFIVNKNVVFVGY